MYRGHLTELNLKEIKIFRIFRKNFGSFIVSNKNNYNCCENDILEIFVRVFIYFKWAKKNSLLNECHYQVDCLVDH